MADPVERFAEVAARYCAWAESSPGSPEEEAVTALRLLPELYRTALDLPAAGPGDEDLAERPSDEWKAFLNRFGNSLPVGSYRCTLGPLDYMATETGISMLGDDLASIYQELKGPLDWYRAGRIEEATWEWKIGFQIHFGAHITGALGALHLWYADQFPWSASLLHE